MHLKLESFEFVNKLHDLLLNFTLLVTIQCFLNGICEISKMYNFQPIKKWKQFDIAKWTFRIKSQSWKFNWKIIKNLSQNENFKNTLYDDSHTNKEDTHVYKMLCEFHSLRVGGDVVCTLAHGGQGMELWAGRIWPM